MKFANVLLVFIPLSWIFGCDYLKEEDKTLGKELVVTCDPSPCAVAADGTSLRKVTVKLSSEDSEFVVDPANKTLTVYVSRGVIPYISKTETPRTATLELNQEKEAYFFVKSDLFPGPVQVLVEYKKNIIDDFISFERVCPDMILLSTTGPRIFSPGDKTASLQLTAVPRLEEQSETGSQPSAEQTYEFELRRKDGNAALSAGFLSAAIVPSDSKNILTSTYSPGPDPGSVDIVVKTVCDGVTVESVPVDLTITAPQ